MARVLIISNDEGSRYLYQVAISYQKISVDVANTISSGIKNITKSKPDMVILDISVPDIKDLSLLQELKTKTGQMPLVILTDMKNSDQNKEAGILGACKFMIKGQNSLGELIKTVRGAIK